MKRVFLFSILTLLFLSLGIINEISAEELEGEEAAIEKAYICLENKVADSCSSSLEDNIFTLLAIEKCEDEIISKSRDGKCWPSTSCDVKTTAQSVLALRSVGIDTTEAENWLLSQYKISTDLNWYLEIESNDATKCNIEYDGRVYPISINEDRKINTNAGSCLTLSEGGWWFKISENCYNKEFKVSCDKGFLTTLLFKEKSSSTIHVMEETHSSSAGGATVEKINSLCFTKNGNCYYEGSLWATLVLYYLGYDMSPYIPYLTVMKDENEKFLPESFLYLITGSFDFRNELLANQINNKYWEESGNKFYDTAVALFSLYYEGVEAEANAKNWLLEVQGSDGCWNNGNIRDTAFLLYSVWPSYFQPDIQECSLEHLDSCDEEKCENIGGYWYEDTCNENECETDDQCESGYECINGDCVEIGEECSVNHLELCNETNCASIGGGYWYDGRCNEEECGSDDQCDPGYECIDGICFEIGSESCNSNNLELCNETECEEIGRYWYDGICNEYECETDEQCVFGYECSSHGICIKIGEDKKDCIEEGKYCMSEIFCEGRILDNYECDQGTAICCDTPKSNTCFEQGGEICLSSETCSGTTAEASDLGYGEICCINGYCQSSEIIDPEETQCEKAGGICRLYGCEDDEEEAVYECEEGDTCCMDKGEKETSYWWIWILVILIILAILGIIFRNKLKPYYLRIISKFGKGKPKRGPPGIFPSSPNALRRPMPRRILPPRRMPPRYPPTRHPPINRPSSNKKNDVDDVIKKLKEMGK